MRQIIESAYPIAFRQEEAKRLGNSIREHSSVVLVGMKRVGISNFLRFFLYHPDIQRTYINNGAVHYFIPVDLNDLVERDIVPFWTLVLTRFVDATQTHDLPEDVKAACRKIFRESIQLKDPFFTIDSIRKIIALLPDDIYLTFFFIRFDRIKEALTPECFANLQGLKEAANQRLSYVFTSFRPLYQLAPKIFPKSSLTVFSHDLFIQPAKEADRMMILDTFTKRYQLQLPKDLASWIVTLSGGHVQYLQLALICLRDEKHLPKSYQQLLDRLLAHEGILLLSEELFENLTKGEQEVLLLLCQGKKQTPETAPYVWDTGMVSEDGVFSPLLTGYLQKIQGTRLTETEFTKKEHLLFSYLKGRLGELSEREDIVAAVWPEYAELGVSDWAIDRLVARVRAKLKAQKSPYEITTVITRGYKLVPAA